MKKLRGYFKSSLYNILQNKLYSVFYVMGTALAFVFIILLLQYYKIVSTDVTPVVHSNRLFVYDKIPMIVKNELTPIPLSSSDISLLESYIPDKKLYGVFYTTTMSAEIGEHYLSVTADCVDKEYFDIYRFHFVEGRPFTKEELEAGDRVTVLKKEIADSYFQGSTAIIGKEILLNKRVYKVIGVVDDFSTFAAPDVKCNIWLPYKSGRWKIFPVGINVLFKEGIDEAEMKSQLANAVQTVWSTHMGVKVKPEDLLTLKEKKLKEAGIGSLALGGAIVLLLLIPALNILTLNLTNVYTRAGEMAIRRAVGSTKMAVFFQQMMEVFILILAGLILGIVLALPMLDGIQSFLLGADSQEEMSLIPWLDDSVILFQVIPLTILFAFLSGGIPVYVIVRKNIADILKGGVDKE